MFIIGYSIFPYFARHIFNHIIDNQQDDVFFIINESVKDNYEGSLGLLGMDKNVFKIDTVTGEMYEINSPLLKIEPGESVLLKVSFKKTFPAKKMEIAKPICLLKQTWKVLKASRMLWNGTDFYYKKIEMEELMELLNANSFSGWIEYQNKFIIDDSFANWELKFSSLLYAAQVWVNEQFVGHVVYSPYTLQITGTYIRPGENTIRLKVYNTSADYLRSEEFKKLANRICNEQDLAYNDCKVRNSYPNSPRWQNKYTIMAENWDNLRKGIGFNI